MNDICFFCSYKNTVEFYAVYCFIYFVVSTQNMEENYRKTSLAAVELVSVFSNNMNLWLASPNIKQTNISSFL